VPLTRGRFPPPSYSLKRVEGKFCELRPNGFLRSLLAGSCIAPVLCGRIFLCRVQDSKLYVHKILIIPPDVLWPLL
jgi:hypothetical protein